MQQLTVIESVTLDGVMQGPGRADEDPRDGGWAVPYGDEVLGRAMGERMASSTATSTGVIMATLRPADRQEDR